MEPCKDASVALMVRRQELHAEPKDTKVGQKQASSEQDVAAALIIELGEQV